MLQGFDALAECNGAGGAFQIVGLTRESTLYGQVDEVVIRGFHVRNAIGGSLNGGYAGGVDAKYIMNISVLDCTFEHCTGVEAGAIAVTSLVSSGGLVRTNTRTFHNLTISNCNGGVGNTRGGGAAGSISVSYDSSMSSNSGNNHVFSNLQIYNSSGGTSTQYGGAAGSISVSHHLRCNSLAFGCNSNNNHNTHVFSNLQITNSSGGSSTLYGGAAGSISVSYYTSNGGSYNSNSFNTHVFSNLQITNSSGGSSTLYGGAAGSISVSYASDTGSRNSYNSFNTHVFSNLQITNSSGGTDTKQGGAAGSISLSYYSYSNRYNTHVLSNLQIVNSSGHVRRCERTAKWSCWIHLSIVSQCQW